jgi:hypothetical protein
MKQLIATAVLLLMTPALAAAQNAEKQSQGEGYVFIAPILSNKQFRGRSGVNTGFGGEVFVYKGLGAGVEAGYAAPDFSFGRIGMGVASFNASYHFFSKKNQKRIEPFVVGGYSFYYGERSTIQNGFNLGGGVNWWLAKHAALRLEICDQDHINYFHGYSPFIRFVAFRVGMTFR